MLFLCFRRVEVVLPVDISLLSFCGDSITCMYEFKMLTYNSTFLVSVEGVR